MDTKGGKLRWGGDDGVLNWAIGIDMYTLMCIKLMPNKNLQYKKINNKKRKARKQVIIITPKSHIMLMLIGRAILTRWIL